jgi:hypothetical protein
MARPAGKCSFCGGPRLTKGHIWPDCFGKILPSDALYHEEKVGTFDTFTSTIPGPPKFERVGTGALQKRRPRNTCGQCNSGWMSRLETNCLPVVSPLLLGETALLDTAAQLTLAATLVLVSMRVELTAKRMGTRTIPQAELDHLRCGLLPSNSWRVWLARHIGADLKDYHYRYTAMQVASESSSMFGPEYCNTQVTTLVAGQLYVHILFSTVWPNFVGYEGIGLTRLWPPIYPYIDTCLLPPMSDEDGIALHEAITRAGKTPDGV